MRLERTGQAPPTALAPALTLAITLLLLLLALALTLALAPAAGRDMLEELMDDEGEIRDMNLSSRPLREDRRKQRERERLAREMERGDEQRARAADGGMSTLEWSSSSAWEKQEKKCAP